MTGGGGIVFDVKHFSLHDGPGIRTAVFLKGCPLRCIWCHNPESLRPEPEPMPGADGAAETVGREWTVAEVLAEVAGDAPFYAASGGGATLSGGEPLMQPAFALALLDALGAAGIHRCLDTAGAAPGPVVEQAARRCELVLYDIKATDEAAHRGLAGGPLAPVLENLARIGRVGTPVRLRCPLVPGINDDPGHLERIGRLAEGTACVEAVELLPYHRFGLDKHVRLGFEPDGRMAGVAAPSDGQVAAWIETVKQGTGKPVRKG